MPGGFQVNITLDDEKFEAFIADWNKTVRLQNDIASMEAARTLAERVQELLSIWPHPAGTPSPTARFVGPPGLISGHLRDSVTVNESVLPGQATVGVGAVYARIQEMGGFAGTNHSTYVPPRPYFRPIVLEFGSEIDPTGAQHIFFEHWRKSMLDAVAGILF
jgi:phage gpG-like protein